MTKYMLILIALSGLLAGCTDVAKQEATSAAPMLDGQCSEYSQKLADLSAVAAVYVLQDSESVWLCFSMPAGSFPTGEYTLTSPALATTHVLHVSAQLGQWPEGATENVPDSPTSELWWNNRGWHALTPNFNGHDVIEGESQPRFLPTGGQEIQFSKDVFGRGEWRFGGAFWMAIGENGELGRLAISSPEGGDLVFTAD